VFESEEFFAISYYRIYLFILLFIISFIIVFIYYPINSFIYHIICY